MAKNMIYLKSSEGHVFEVEEAVAAQSKMIQLMIDDGCTSTAIPLKKVTSEILVNVIEYCKRHHAVDKKISCPSGLHLNKASSSSTSDASISISTSTDDLKKFDDEFVKVDWETLKGIILAAYYLEIEDLLDRTCQAAVDYIKNKSPEEVRTLFNREYAWAFE